MRGPDQQIAEVPHLLLIIAQCFPRTKFNFTVTRNSLFYQTRALLGYLHVKLMPNLSNNFKDFGEL